MTDEITVHEPERYIVGSPRTRPYGEWLREKLEASDIDDVKHLSLRLQQMHPNSDSKFSATFLYDMVNERRYANGSAKRPSAELAIAIAEALNREPATLDLEVNDSLVAAGHAPITPAVVLFDLRGNPIVSRPDGTFAAPTSAENAAIYQLLEQQSVMLRRLMAHLGLK